MAGYQKTKRRVLVLINPFAGAGAAVRNWQVAQRIFELAKSRISYKVVQTKYANHAFKIVQDLNVDEWDSIVFVSGDGLLHEIINGLMLRNDWNLVKHKITVGGIPGGTGNGLIKSLLYENNEEYGVQEAAWMIIRGRKEFMDITELQLEYHSKPVYSFLSVSWAVIADCDLNSEVLRFLGKIRFDLWGVWRVLSMVRYRGTLQIEGQQIKNKNIDQKNSDLLLVPQKYQFKDHDFTYFISLNIAWIASNLNSGPLARVSDGKNDLITSRVQQGSWNWPLGLMLLSLDCGNFFTQKGDVRPELAIDYFKSKTWSLDPHVKGRHKDFEAQAGYEYNERAVFSIDGERFKSQRVDARVLEQEFPIYM